MAYKIRLKNHRGDVVNLTSSPRWQMVKAEGLTPVDADINLSENANTDGGYFRSSRLGERNIVLTLYLNNNAEANRLELYKYIKTKKPVTLYIDTNYRHVYINGYVESLSAGIFDKKEKVQISIICPNPYFLNENESVGDFAYTQDELEFPLDLPEEGLSFGSIINETEINIHNGGDVETGMLIHFYVDAPDIQFPTLWNDAGQGIGLNLGVSGFGNDFYIDTRQGQKRAWKIYQGEEINITNAVMLKNTNSWLQLEAGDNVMTYGNDGATEYPQSIRCDVRFYERYEGV